MGFFDSKSKTSVSNVYDTNTTTTQADQSGNSGVAVANGGSYSDSSVLTVDSRTLNDSRSVSDSRDQRVSDSGNTYIDQGAVAGGLGLAGNALSAIQRVNADSIELLGNLVSGSIDASKTLAREGAQANSNVLADALGGFKELAVQNSQTDSDKMTKVIGLALAAVVAIFVLPSLFKGGAGRSLVIS